MEPLTPTPSAARPSMLRRSDVYSDPRFSGYNRGRRPGIARWVVGLVGLGIAAVVGFTFFQKELVPRAVPTAAAPADERVDVFLEQGDQRLFEGEIEAAQEQYVKASAVAEADPRVSRALAKVAVVRADLLWLHKLLTREGTPHHEAIAHQLVRAVGRARAASDAAHAKAPDDPVTASLSVDVLRLEGKADEARKLVSRVEGAGPDGARALAALDLTEESPSFGSVLDRLRTAARAERKLGRAQAMLVYALVRAGKHEEAQKELASLEAASPNHSLLVVLRHYVEGTAPPDEAPPEPSPTPPAGPRHVKPSGPAEPFATAEPQVPAPENGHPDPSTPEDDTPPESQPPGTPPEEQPPATPPEGQPPATPAPDPTSDLPPGIDVSDLPEYQ